MPMDIGGIAGSPHIVVSFSWLDRFILALVGALLGAFFAYVSNAIHSRRQKKIETVLNVAEEFLRLLDKLDGLIKDLWSQSRKELGQARELALSSSITLTQWHIDDCLRLVFNLKKRAPRARYLNWMFAKK